MKQGEAPAKRDLDTMVTLLSDAPNICLAFKRTRFNVCAFCMSARTVAARELLRPLTPVLHNFHSETPGQIQRPVRFLFRKGDNLVIFWSFLGPADSRFFSWKRKFRKFKLFNG